MDSLKTSEKISIWLKRKGWTQQDLAVKLNMTRQTLILRLKHNAFKPDELTTLKTLGYEG